MPDISSPALSIETPSGTMTQDTSWVNLLWVHKDIDEMMLTASAVRVYAHLARRSTHQTHHCYPGIREISVTCRLDKETVLNAVRELENRGMIMVTKKRGGGNDYFLPGPSSWIRQYETPQKNRRCTDRRNRCTDRRNTDLEAAPVNDRQTVRIDGTPSSCTDRRNGTVRIDGTKVIPIKYIPDNNCSDDAHFSQSERQFELVPEEQSKPKPKRKPVQILAGQTLSAVIEELRLAYTWVDFDKAIIDMRTWLKSHPGRKLTRRFIENWIKKIDRPLKDDYATRRPLPCRYL